jgi:hypothetical protein
MALVPDEGDPAVEALSTEGFGRSRPGEAAADDQEVRCGSHGTIPGRT